MDQLEQLLDMIEHPDYYTDEQIKALLSDPDLYKHYEMLVSLRMKIQPQLSPKGKETNMVGGSAE